jgi:hypothetical protein
MRHRIGLLLLCLSAAGCSGDSGRIVSVPGRGIASYDVADEPEQCVPYARRISGITLYGDAWTWWDQAIEVDLDRGEEPRRGAVLVLDRTSRLSHGHLAVVVTVVDDREIVVSQSNWGSDGDMRRRIYSALSVVDISPDNDWSELRFFNPDTGTFGGVYQAAGFIYG